MITWSFALLVLLLFWRRKQKSVLDLWLVVVGVMLLMSAALSALLNTGRFDFGFCFGRRSCGTEPSGRIRTTRGWLAA